MAQNAISRCCTAWKRFQGANIDPWTTNQLSFSRFNPSISYFPISSPLFFSSSLSWSFPSEYIYFLLIFFLIIKFQCRSYLVHRFILLQLQMGCVNVGSLWTWRPHGRNPSLVVGSFVAKWLQNMRISVVNSRHITKIRPIYRVFSSGTNALQVKSVLVGKWTGFSCLGLGIDYMALMCKWSEVLFVAISMWERWILCTQSTKNIWGSFVPHKPTMFERNKLWVVQEFNRKMT